jgi:hypothetical protein
MIESFCFVCVLEGGLRNACVTLGYVGIRYGCRNIVERINQVERELTLATKLTMVKATLKQIPDEYVPQTSTVPRELPLL